MKDIVAGVLLLSSIIGLAVWMASIDAEQWGDFAAKNNCKVFSTIGPSYGNGFDAKGNITFVSIPGKTGWRCSDGKEYWR